MEKRQQQEQEEKRELVPIEEEGEDYTLHVVLFFGGSVPLVALTQLAGLGITGFVGAAVVAALLAVSGPELVKRLLQGNRFPGLDWQRLSLALSYASDERYVVDADLVDEPDEGLVQEDGDELQVTKPEQQKGQQGPWVPAQFMLDDVLDIVHLFNKKHAVYFGDSEHGAIAIPLRVMYHVIDVSSSGKGKSNRFRLAMIQMVNHCETYYINPFAANVKAVTDDRKIEVWKPIFDRLANKRPVKEGPDILRLMTALVNEIESRNDQEGAGDFSWREKPIFILIDELPEVFARCPQAIELLDKIGRTGQQFCVFSWIASQTAAVKETGQSTAAQANYKTRIYGGGDRNSSGRLMKGSIPMESEQALQSNGAGLTLMLADGFSALEFVRAPLVSNEALFAYFGLPPFRIEEWLAPTTSKRPAHRLEEPVEMNVSPFTLSPQEEKHAQNELETPGERVKGERSERVKGPNEGAILDALNALEEERKPLTLNAIARKASLTWHQYEEIEMVAAWSGYELDRGRGRPKEG